MAQASDELAPESDLPKRKGSSGEGTQYMGGAEGGGGKVRGQVRKS